jgi:hypothetical protein
VALIQTDVHQITVRASVAVDGIVGPITWQALVSGMLSG